MDYFQRCVDLFRLSGLEGCAKVIRAQIKALSLSAWPEANSNDHFRTPESQLNTNHPASLCRRRTRWLGRNEQARFFHYRKHDLLAPLRNNVRR